MADRSKIEWTEASWNALVGCTYVSDGCKNCYARVLHDRRYLAWKRGRFAGAPQQYRQPFRNVQLIPDRLDIPLRWRKPRRVFVNSLSDLFHDAVPDDFIADVFAVMAIARQHTFQILTKRPRRMAQLVSSDDFRERVDDAMEARASVNGWCLDETEIWPLTNVWLGVSVEDQRAADERIPLLLATPAVVRFLSCEPLLGAVDLSAWIDGITWVIVGGESGSRARPMHPDWARSLRDQCQAAGTAYHYKQTGEWAENGDYRALRRGLDSLVLAPDGHRVRASRAEDVPVGSVYLSRLGRREAGRLLDGVLHDAFPVVTP